MGVIKYLIILLLFIITHVVIVNTRNPLLYAAGIRTNYSTEYFSERLIDSCYMRRCLSNDQCCSQSICLSLDENIGYCFLFRGLNYGENCKEDKDCDYHLVCRRTSHFEFGKCRESDYDKLMYGQVCNSTMDCNFRNGLCCISQKRARQKPRNICSYYTNPLRCIDVVPADSRRKDPTTLTHAEKISPDQELKDFI